MPTAEPAKPSEDEGSVVVKTEEKIEDKAASPEEDVKKPEAKADDAVPEAEVKPEASATAAAAAAAAPKMEEHKHHSQPTPEFYPPHKTTTMIPAHIPTLHHPNQDATNNNDSTPKRKKRQYNIKNPNRPKRPLSAYNVFFKYERERLVREEMLKDENADVEKVEELIAIRDTTKTGKRVHRKTHGELLVIQ